MLSVCSALHGSHFRSFFSTCVYLISLWSSTELTADLLCPYLEMMWETSLRYVAAHKWTWETIFFRLYSHFCFRLREQQAEHPQHRQLQQWDRARLWGKLLTLSRSHKIKDPSQPESCLKDHSTMIIKSGHCWVSEGECGKSKWKKYWKHMKTLLLASLFTKQQTLVHGRSGTSTFVFNPLL